MRNSCENFEIIICYLSKNLISSMKRRYIMNELDNEIKIKIILTKNETFFFKVLDSGFFRSLTTSSLFFTKEAIPISIKAKIKF
jgi:hypothetical protein